MRMNFSPKSTLIERVARMILVYGRVVAKEIKAKEASIAEFNH